MLQWMNLNAVEDLEEDQVWLAEDFMVWLKQFLFQQGYIMEQNLTEFPFVYDLETRTAIESFQRIYEIEDGKEPEEYEYGVADNETLQKIYDILAMQKLAMAEDAE